MLEGIVLLLIGAVVASYFAGLIGLLGLIVAIFGFVVIVASLLGRPVFRR